jgi:hypothetical protein
MNSNTVVPFADLRRCQVERQAQHCDAPPRLHRGIRVAYQAVPELKTFPSVLLPVFDPEWPQFLHIIVCWPAPPTDRERNIVEITMRAAGYRRGLHIVDGSGFAWGDWQQ